MRSLLLATALLSSLAGCLESSTGPEGSGAARIRLHVTGGFAGVDYTIYMDGPGGVVVGESCVAYCDFQDGDVLQTLSRDQAIYLTGLFLDAGVHSLDGTDFGYECCDQFHYELIYRDGDGTSTVRGSSQVFPGGSPKSRRSDPRARVRDRPGGFRSKHEPRHLAPGQPLRAEVGGPWGSAGAPGVL